MGFLASLKKTVSRSKAEKKPDFHVEFNLGKLLGEGGFATVYGCEQKKGTPEELAVKVFDFKKDSGARKDFRLEVEIMRRIGAHPSCVQFLEAFEDRRFGYLVMEKCSCSILDAFLGKEQATECELAQAFHSLLTAVDHLHSIRIVHRDIKPCNLLLKDDARGEKIDVKLCDMGLSCILPQEGSKRFGCIPISAGLTEMCGTTPYMSPEMLSDKRYSEVVDEWSSGVTMYVLMFGEFPYKTTRRDMDLMKEMICSGKWKPSYKARAGLPQPSGLACELVAALMNRDPASRVTAAEALQYDFLTACLPKKPSKSSVPDEIEFVIPPVVQMQNPRASPNESHSFAWSPSFHPTLLHARSTVLEYEECTPVHRKQTVEEALAALQQQQGKQWQRTGTRCMSEPFLRVNTVDSELQRLPARLCTHSGLSGLSMSTVGEDKANDDFSLPGTPSTTEGPRLSTSTTGDSDSQLSQ